MRVLCSVDPFEEFLRLVIRLLNSLSFFHNSPLSPVLITCGKVLSAAEVRVVIIFFDISVGDNDSVLWFLIKSSTEFIKESLISVSFSAFISRCFVTAFCFCFLQAFRVIGVRSEVNSDHCQS